MKCRMCRRVDSDFGLSTSGKAGQQGEGQPETGKREMPELQILPPFLPCLEEEEEKAAAERGEGQGFAIDSCRVFCGNGLAEI